MKVEAHTTLQGGVLKSKKSVRGADGKLQFTISDRLSEIGASECKRRFKRLERDVSNERQRYCASACAKLKACETTLDLPDKKLESIYCQDRCMSRQESKAFRCVMALPDGRCSALADCVQGRDID